MVEKEKETLSLYHGTPYKNIKIILKEGLKGHYGPFKGPMALVETPLLFLTPYKSIASKFGYVIKIQIPKKDLKKFDFTIVKDAVGNENIVLEGKNEEEILIPPEYIVSPQLFPGTNYLISEIKKMSERQYARALNLEEVF